ncbi:LLM class flavin-dependent oxidoreductase [Amycolatopsis alkalitolerans]|uniref:LLM class flavin-dependent oxidoreductase n=1 Tax=Amycolatopsis alkalitolerans TaxID=2547244 RepID=A0A5C4LZ85_9PSEU|nr:LLM class flavin-dependent oxidoreductase [Amycolatopsis alkalitolerans]TNC25156.1 LLM class flavin-dependent oxidoreductase [Amycolatopsis alkalitolerans]
MNGPRFGLRLPPIAVDAPPDTIGTIAVACEKAGLASFWLPDRLVGVDGYLRFLGESQVLDPLVGLAYCAAVTSRIQLGTAVLVAPFRHPLALTKAVASLQAVTGDRLVLGVGTGWNRDEFAAIGLDARQRGSRTDETLDVLRGARGHRVFAHRGRHFRFDEVLMGPPVRNSLELWIAGGPNAGTYHQLGPPEFARPVLDRISRAEGWLSRPTTSVTQIRAGRVAITERRKELGTDGGPFTVAHVNWCHLVDGTREQALSQQEAAFAEALGKGTPFEVARQLHWTGSLADVRDRVAQLVDAGVEHIVASPVAPGPEQVELWATGVLEPWGFRPEN